MQTIATDSHFPPATAADIGAIAELIIPADSGLGIPGANDPMILGRVLAQLGGRAEEVTEALQPLRALALEGFDSEFSALESDDQMTVLEAFGRRQPVINWLSTAVVQSYYSDPRVLQSLDLPGEPPFPSGHDVPEGDWSLLEPVKTRDKIYRPV